MKRWLKAIVFGIVVAAATHAAVVYAIPRVLMHTVMAHIGRDGRVNSWRHGHRVTSDSRTVVRPSPNLASAACVYDVRHGPVHIRVPPAPDYWSLSLYAADSDNIRVWNNASHPHGVDIWLVDKHTPRAGLPSAATVMHVPSDRGMALIRRMAENDAAWKRVQAIRSNDQCEAIH